MCIRKGKRQNTTTQVPALLNGCSSMKRREKDDRQSVCE